MKKVEFWAYANFPEKAFYGGDCFEEALLIELTSLSKHEEYSLLLDEINKRKSRNHPQDILYEIFSTELILNFEFSKELNLFDTIYPNCFYSETDLGKVLIKLIDVVDFAFILKQREWYSPEYLYLDFDVCHKDFSSTIISMHLKGEMEP